MQSFLINPYRALMVGRVAIRALSITPTLNQEFKDSYDLAKERYDARANEDIDKKRARLLYQSRKRGMLENGVILSSFADKYLNELDADELTQYDKLINLPTNDWDIYYWATKTKPTPAEFETSVMNKLRLHLHSKVSNSASQMTDWRRRYNEKRLKRALSQPVSVRHMSEDKVDEVYTQKVEDKTIATEELPAGELIDSPYDKSIKHHNFMQHLLSSKFTDNPLDYDDEAEAWANVLWHRNYGSAYVRVAPSSLRCFTCNEILHCCDPGINGYVPKEVLASLDSTKSIEAYCNKCKFSNIYGAAIGVDSKKEALKELNIFRPSIVIVLVDLTDTPQEILKMIPDGFRHKIIVVGNKLDLLPSYGIQTIKNVTWSLRTIISKFRRRVPDVMVLSARTGFGVESLISRILIASDGQPKDVYLLGCSNSGKSTLFSALLQSDLSAIREGDLLSRISTYRFPGIQSELLKFPINPAEGWEVALKEKKMERVERNTARYHQSFEGTTKHRQATAPHMSMLIDRIHYPALNSTSLVIDTHEVLPRFTEDHPLSRLPHDKEPLSATQDNYPEHGFFYNTPSYSHRDQLHDLITNEEHLDIFPNETIVPRKYSVRPLQSIFVAGLARLDVLTANANIIVTIFASKYLPIHVIATRKADQFYQKFLGSPYLGVPFGDEERIKQWPGLSSSGEDIRVEGAELHPGSMDVVLGSIGWALVNVNQDQECLVRAYTPEGRGIYSRCPPLLPDARRIKGRKIRDTPLFQHSEFKIERVIA